MRHAALRAPARVGEAVLAPFTEVPGPFPKRQDRQDRSFEPHATAAQARAMRWFWWDGFWGAVTESVVMNYLALFALAFGASNSQVGFLASFSSLFAALAFFPGARFAERFGRRRATVLAAQGGISRVLLLGFALIPFVAHGHAAVWIVIGLASLRGLWAWFSNPAWTSLTADIVPIGIRGRFLASRSFGMSLATLAAAPLAGLLIDRFSGLAGWQLVWVVAFVAGALSTWCYARIAEPPSAPHEQEAAGAGDPGFFAALGQDRNFMAYLASLAAWNVALYAAGPFFNVYLVRNLGASTAWVGFLGALPAFTGLAGLASFGRVMDRRGTKWVMAASALLIPALPVAWLFVTAAWQVIFINAVSGVLWAGYNLANGNMVMVMAPPGRRARYAAASQTVTYAAAFAGPLLGGLVIALMGFHAVFALSAAGRLVAALVLLRFVHARFERPHA